MTDDLIREAADLLHRCETQDEWAGWAARFGLRLIVALEQALERARIAETDLHVIYPEWLAERDRLTVALEKMRCRHDAEKRDLVEQLEDLAADCDRLRAENEKLRDVVSIVREIRDAAYIGYADGTKGDRHINAIGAALARLDSQETP